MWPSRVRLVWLALVAVAGSPARQAVANPSPCADRSMAGRHVYVAVRQPDIHMRSERLRFQVQRSSYLDALVEVDVDYVFDNRGRALDLVIGFPVSDIAVSAFRVNGDGVGKRVVPTAREASDWLKNAELVECEEASSEPSETLDSYHWFLWQQHLRPGPSRLRVRYLLRWRANDMTEQLVVDYVLRTGRNWGNGRIGRLDIELRDPTRPRGQQWHAYPTPTEIGDHGRRLRWSYARYRPVRDLQMRLEATPDDS